MRIKGLDSIRGIASLIVWLFHIIITAFPTFWYHPKILTLGTLFLNGDGAVIVFFVLSGCVLTFSIVHSGDNFSITSFFKKRLARLYVPYLAATLIAASLLAIVHFSGHLIERPDHWSFPPIANLPSLILMVGLTGDQLLNGPSWTLFVEVQASLVMPIIALLNKSTMWKFLLGVMFISCLSGLWYSTQPLSNWHEGTNIGTRLALSLFYVQFFAIGSAIAIYSQEISKILNSISLPTAIGISIILFFSQAVVIFNVPALRYFVHSAIAIWVISNCLSFQRIDQILSHTVFAYFGKISFSLYITHLPILLFTFAIFTPTIGRIGALALGAALTAPIAVAFYHYVEVPSVRLGQRLANRANFRSSGAQP
jgi:peptidoglycan/LPS O-acetylase OafA/YrhL